MIAWQLTFAAACRASAIAMSMSRRRSRLGVTGWVRNRRDGTVEALVQGDEARVLELCLVPARSAGARVAAIATSARAVDPALDRVRVPRYANSAPASRAARCRRHAAGASRMPKMSFQAA